MVSRVRKKVANLLFRLYMVLVALFFLSIPTSFVYWKMMPDKPIDVIIIDKTVPTREYREHNSLMWILNNLKYVDKKTDKPFRYDKDYYGFVPLRETRYNVRELPEDLESPDLIYLTDTLGVYKNDLNLQTVTGKRSDLLYGGTERQDIDTIKRSMLQTTVLIAEFDTLATPTNAVVSRDMESLMGVEWTGWTGRYFIDLNISNDEIPRWLIAGYEKQGGKKWLYNGPGFAFVHKSGTVFVMAQGRDIGNRLLEIDFKREAVERFGVQDKVRYYYWFDIVKPKVDVEVIANYNLDVTARGRAILDRYGLKKSFPAVVRKETPFVSYYFAGDFADNKPIPRIYNSFLIRPVYSVLTKDAPGNTNNFFFEVYYPLIRGILEETPR